MDSPVDGVVVWWVSTLVPALAAVRILEDGSEGAGGSVLPAAPAAATSEHNKTTKQSNSVRVTLRAHRVTPFCEITPRVIQGE